MKPFLLRKTLHQYIDTLPPAALREIYRLIAGKCTAKLQQVMPWHSEQLSDVETDLLLQQFLS